MHPSKLVPLIPALLIIAAPAYAQVDLEALKAKCDACGFVRGTPDHADCVRKLDMEQIRLRCQALVQRGHQVCSKEFAEVTGSATATAQCMQVQDLYQQYCQ